MTFRVLELPGTVATRYCGRLFVQLGAEVVQPEPPPASDERIGFGGAAGLAYGAWLDAGKVRQPATGQFDLVIAWDQEVDVGGIALVLRWFDRRGPYRDWPGTDETILALAGLAYSFGPPEGPPTLAQGHGPQVIAGANAFNAGLAALLALPTHRPHLVEVDVFESTMCLSEVGAVAAMDDERSRSTRLGVNRFSPTYPCTSYPTADGWAGVTCLTPPQWTALCDVIGRPDVGNEHRYSTAFRRLMRADEVDAVLRPVFAGRETSEWVKIGIERRIPITAMPRPAELPAEAQWQARRSFGPLPLPGEGEGAAVEAPTLPWRATYTGEAVNRWASTDEHGPLAGVRVVDFSMGWSGPQATRLLADLGADVVKVESEDHPDWYRGWEAPVLADPPPTEVRASFNTLNRNKRGVVLELATPEGLAAAKALVARADIVIDNFAAGVLERLGLGHDVQRRLNGGVISVSMPAFGSHGPLAGIRAYGSTVEQASGLPFVNGEEGWPPCLQHVAFGDPVAGVFAVSAMLTALTHRARRGGASIDLSQVECLFQIGADAIIAEQVTRRPVRRTGGARPRYGVSAVVPAAGDDNWVAVTGDLEMSVEELAAWAAGRDVNTAAADLRSHGVAAAPVQPAHALGTDEQLVATGFWQTLERAFVGRHTLGAPALRFDGSRPPPRRPAPTLGEHTAEILAAVPSSP